MKWLRLRVKGLRVGSLGSLGVFEGVLGFWVFRGFGVFGGYG